MLNSLTVGNVPLLTGLSKATKFWVSTVWIHDQCRLAHFESWTSNFSKSWNWWPQLNHGDHHLVWLKEYFLSIVLVNYAACYSIEIQTTPTNSPHIEQNHTKPQKPLSVYTLGGHWTGHHDCPCCGPLTVVKNCFDVTAIFSLAPTRGDLAYVWSVEHLEMAWSTVDQIFIHINLYG